MTFLTINKEYIRIHWPDNSNHADFHYFWLRHNCPCCVHPKTKERTLCPSKVNLAIAPLTANVVKDKNNHYQLSIRWDEKPAHESIFSIDWLAQHAYSQNASRVTKPNNDLTNICFDYKQIATATTDFFNYCKEKVNKGGLVVIKKYQGTPESLIDGFEDLGWTLFPSHFGRIEDLRPDNTTNKNNDQLGYTNAAVDLHTDQPFIDEPPRFQMLYCMVKADSGGKNILVDAKQAALFLRDQDLPAFETLTTTPTLLHRKQAHFTSKTNYPVLSFKNGQFDKIRLSYFTLAPQTYHFSLMKNWYEAYQKFCNILHDESCQWQVNLEPTDFVLYDNYRLLHARNSFTGLRWMKGIYFKDEKQKTEVLAETSIA